MRVKECPFCISEQAGKDSLQKNFYQRAAKETLSDSELP
jgi:hypothetical protein